VGHLASWAADINQSALLLQFLLKSFKPPYVKVVVKAIATLVKDTQARKQIGPQAGELVKIIQHSASLGIDQDGSVFSLFFCILVRFQWWSSLVCVPCRMLYKVVPYLHAYLGFFLYHFQLHPFPAMIVLKVAPLTLLSPKASVRAAKY
jgi:hypothetical protein